MEKVEEMIFRTIMGTLNNRNLSLSLVILRVSGKEDVTTTVGLLGGCCLDGRLRPNVNPRCWVT